MRSQSNYHVKWSTDATHARSKHTFKQYDPLISTADNWRRCSDMLLAQCFHSWKPITHWAAPGFGLTLTLPSELQTPFSHRLEPKASSITGVGASSQLVHNANDPGTGLHPLSQLLEGSRRYVIVYCLCAPLLPRNNINVGLCVFATVALGFVRPNSYTNTLWFVKPNVDCLCLYF